MSATGTGWERTPWRATQWAAWEALRWVNRVTDGTASFSCVLRTRTARRRG